MKKIITLTLLLLAVGLKAQPPQVYTLGHDPITTGPRDFNLYGVINGHMNATQYSFVYSTDPNFTTSSTTLVKGVLCDSLVVVYSTVKALTPATNYYYYLTATSSQGTAVGDTLHFYSDTINPLIEIFGADIYPSSFSNFASLNGKVKGLSGSNKIYFQWGETPRLDSILASDAGTITDANAHYPRGSISGLPTGHTYFYRMMVAGATDTVYTDIRGFYMGNPFSKLTTAPATNLSGSNGDLGGQIQGFPLPLKLDVEYGNGLQGYNNHTPLEYVDSNITLYTHVYHATNLLNSWLYGYRFRAESWIGNFYGNDVLFVSGNQDSVVQTLPASSVQDTTARLNGISRHVAMDVYAGFLYGTTPALGTYVITDTLSDSSAHYPTLSLKGLLPNTTYYYCLQVGFRWMNSPQIYGDTLQFTTGALGVNQLNTIENISFHPNPATGLVNITNDGNVELLDTKLFDTNGRLVTDKIVLQNNKMDISSLESGIYFLELYNNNHIKIGVAKLIKQ